MTTFDDVHRLQQKIDQLRYRNRLLTQKLERRDARIERLYAALRSRPSRIPERRRVARQADLDSRLQAPADTSSSSNASARITCVEVSHARNGGTR